MSYTIEQRVEKRRGCGYRKPGGLYLVSGGAAKFCGKLPIECTVCPCCGQGIKFNRGVVKVSSQLIENTPCTKPHCMSDPPQPSGCFPFGWVKEYWLMWVGAKFYPTPRDFMREGAAQGISKRIGQIPKGFEVGKSWILLAHPNVTFYGEDEPEVKQGIFTAFCPERIEYVVTGEETDDDLQAKADAGITLVNVTPEQEQTLTL
ncbi:MAG: hypothetical protein INR73_28400 [Williamsia sp.]|nr:hypothetical protein [Williamsia sp.]